ncbi:MAG: FAD-dependent oxidoreductase [Akkermansiaceae bacterium]|nr:FAD-dependent oxidoreductase [Akkermansiaceae bacterium]
MVQHGAEYDIAILGGGSAGYAAARTAHELGMRTVVIDGADELSGLCILRGCMPSKTLIETANRALAIREASQFGIHVQKYSVSPDRIIERKRELIDEFRDYRTEQLHDGRFDLIRGFGQFTNAHTIEVTLRNTGETITLSAKSTIIATGSNISVANIDGLEEAKYLTSDDVLDSKDVPDSIIVLGGGAIALEMAHYFDGIGKKVTVIQRSEHLLTGMDPDLADTLQGAFKARNLDVFCGTQLAKVAITPDGLKRVDFTQSGEQRSVEAAEILCALGRKPNSGKLAAENAGIKLNRGKIAVNHTMQSSQPNIFGAGDVASPHEIVHIAIEQGEIAARNAHRVINGKSDLEQISYRLKLYGIFTEPQVASVGITEVEAAAKGLKILVETYPFNDHGKSMVHGTEHGFVKLIADAESKEILGGSVIGPEATELIHEIVVAMSFHATANQLAKVPHYHPTLSEIWTYPAEDIAET